MEDEYEVHVFCLWDSLARSAGEYNEATRCGDSFRMHMQHPINTNDTSVCTMPYVCFVGNCGQHAFGCTCFTVVLPRCLSMLLLLLSPYEASPRLTWCLMTPSFGVATFLACGHRTRIQPGGEYQCGIWMYRVAVRVGRPV